MQEDVYQCALIWTDMFIKIAETCIPHKSVVIRPKDKPWMSSEIRRNIKKRRRLFYEFKRTNSDSIRQDYKGIRNKVVSMIKEAKTVHEAKIESILSNAEINSKKWWSILKSEIKGSKQSEIPPIVHGTDIINDNSKKAEMFNSYFIKHSTVDDNDMILHPLTDNVY